VIILENISRRKAKGLRPEEEIKENTRFCRKSGEKIKELNKNYEKSR